MTPLLSTGVNKTLGTWEVSQISPNKSEWSGPSATNARPLVPGFLRTCWHMNTSPSFPSLVSSPYPCDPVPCSSWVWKGVLSLSGGRGAICLQICLWPRCPFLHGLPRQPASVPESRVWVSPQRGRYPAADPLWRQPSLPPGHGSLRQPPLCRGLCLLSFWVAERPNPRASSSHSGKRGQWFCVCFWLFLKLALWVLSGEPKLSLDWHP